jgi:hypothetical protein
MPPDGIAMNAPCKIVAPATEAERNATRFGATNKSVIPAFKATGLRVYA